MRSQPSTLAAPLMFALLGAGCGSAELSLEVETDTSGHGLGTYSEVTSFGANPGALKMFKYVPQNPPQNAPLVLALHACSQTASAYRNAGWEAVADEMGFYVVYPQQETGNNPLRCFNWAGEYGDPTNLMRAEGENQSIIDMIEKMKADHSIDARRIFITGHSGGAAQSALMLATWPEVFAGGAPIAGIPYNCTTTFTEVTTCLNPGIDRTAMEWGNRARDGHSGYSGPWPKVSIWQGSSDSTVAPRNMTEMLEQWTNVHGIDTTADAMDMVDGFPRAKYQDGAGNTLVEVYTLTGMNHGTPVVPGDGCGTAGAYFLDVGICASRRIAEFFGLDGGSMPGDTISPTVNITAPAAGNVSGAVMVIAEAGDNVGVTRVEIFVGGDLKATVTSAPYQYSWNTAGEANGDYMIRVVAYDAAGNSSSDDLTVRVTGGVQDTTAPMVNISAPSAGATVSGTVMITATATDDFSVASVEFFVDGASIGSASTSPYSVSWSTAGVAAGAHAISATARDAAGNSATDDDTMVTVEMVAGDTTPPVVSFAMLADGDSLSGVANVVLDATDDVGLKTALLFLDGDLIGSDYAAPFEFLWDTTVSDEGDHVLTARVFDTTGNIGVAEVMVVVTRADAAPEKVKIGRKYWGCTASPGSFGDQLFPMLLVLGGILLLRRRRALAAVAVAATLSGCTGEDIYVEGADTSTGRFGSGAKISAYLEGKTLTMTGAAIPSHPNGLDEDVNFGQATQCYHSVSMSMLSGRFRVISELGTLSDAPSSGDHGTCDHDTMAAELMFDSTAVLLENARDNGGCFDFTITFPGFGQEGRGALSEDGATLVLELFFKDNAIGHRCADGNVGDPTIVIAQNPFTGDARQTYTVGE